MIKNLSLNEASLTVQGQTLDGSDFLVNVEMQADETWTFSEALDHVAQALGTVKSQISSLKVMAVSNPFIALKFLSFGPSSDSLRNLRIYLASAR